MFLRCRGWLPIAQDWNHFLPHSHTQSGNKKEAERLVKNIIKIVIKIGILHRNNQFSADELKTIDRFRSKFQVKPKATPRSDKALPL